MRNFLNFIDVLDFKNLFRTSGRFMNKALNDVVFNEINPSEIGEGNTLTQTWQVKSIAEFRKTVLWSEDSSGTVTFTLKDNNGDCLSKRTYDFKTKALSLEQRMRNFAQIFGVIFISAAILSPIIMGVANMANDAKNEEDRVEGLTLSSPGGIFLIIFSAVIGVSFFTCLGTMGVSCLIKQDIDKSKPMFIESAQRVVNAHLLRNNPVSNNPNEVLKAIIQNKDPRFLAILYTLLKSGVSRLPDITIPTGSKGHELFSGQINNAATTLSSLPKNDAGVKDSINPCFIP